MITGMLIGAFMCMPVGALADEKKSDKVLATVGKEKITEADIYAKIAMLPPQFRSRYESEDGRKKLLDQTIKFSLLSQEARRLGIDKRDAVAKKIKEISDNIIIQELTKQEGSDKIALTDDVLQAHYKANKNDYIKPEKVKANLILFEVKDDAGSGVKAAQNKKADAALKSIKKGEAFEELAKKLSDDKRTKKRGGSTGFFSRGKRENAYGKKFEEIAFSLDKGEVSAVFESKRGFYLVKIAEKKAKKEQGFDEVRQKIERKLKQEKQKETYESYIEGLKKKYPVSMK